MNTKAMNLDLSLLDCPNCGTRLRLTEDREPYITYGRCYYCAQSRHIYNALHSGYSNNVIQLTRAEVRYIIAKAPELIADLAKADRLSLPRSRYHQVVNPKPGLRALIVSIVTRWDAEIIVWRCAARLLYGTGNDG